MTWNAKLYRKLHRILCTILGHPLWQDTRYGYHECGCGKIHIGN